MKTVANEKLLGYTGKILSMFAVMITLISVNTACAFLVYQPVIPESAKKLRRF